MQVTVSRCNRRHLVICGDEIKFSCLTTSVTQNYYIHSRHCCKNRSLHSTIYVELKFGAQLGSGSFGFVIEATVKHPYRILARYKRQLVIAVKKLTLNVASIIKVSFMQHFSTSPSTVTFIGSTHTSNHLYISMERLYGLSLEGFSGKKYRVYPIT